MCLFIKKGCKIEIAREAISVFKLIFKTSEKEWKSYSRKTIHNYNHELKAVDHLTSIKLFDSESYIEEGYHAFVDKESASHCISDLVKRYTSFIIKDLEVVFAAIPPGAEYCYGTMNEIITNRAIIYKHWWELKSYFESIEQKPKIADKDIVCKKSVSEITDKYWIPEIIQDNKFLCNVIVKALDGTKKPIEHLKYFPMFGFHSYIDVKKAKGSILVDAIVPKGSEYFEKDGIIVSNKIIVKSCACI